jgi:hypothetical protein
VHLATSLMSRGARSVLKGVCPDRGHWVWEGGRVLVMVFTIRGIGDWRLRLEADRGRQADDKLTGKSGARMLWSVNIMITY